MKNIVLDYMKANHIPLTRANYLSLAFMGNPPKELGAEEEADMPKELIDEGDNNATRK
jgi:hypothetical protein